MIDSMEIKESLDLTITRLLFLMITMHAGTPELIFVRSDLIVNSKAFKNDYYTPARTLSISGLKSRVLKLSFLSLKMMVKSGLEFILKFTEPFKDTCSAAMPIWPFWADIFALGSSNSAGAR